MSDVQEHLKTIKLERRLPAKVVNEDVHVTRGKWNATHVNSRSEYGNLVTPCHQATATRSYAHHIGAKNSLSTCQRRESLGRVM
jgi:hypothetical protein